MAKETLTRGEGQIVLDDIKKEIKRLDALIKEKKIVGATVEVLDEKKELLQKQIDNILKKGGIITEEDYNKSYNIIRGQEEKELLDLSKKAKRRIVMFALIGVGIIATYYLLAKKK
jgi:polyhydroxyalkanoate synthesis regulator phasin